MRKVIAARLTESKATIPHYYSRMECSIDNMLAFRKTLKAAGVTKFEKTSYLGDGGSEPCPSCAVSKQPAWLLSVHWEGGAVTDGEHTPPGCSWASTRKTVKVSRTQDELKKLEAALDERLAQRERWLEAAAKALETEPPLEAVDALLAEARDMQIHYAGLDTPARRLLAQVTMWL